VRPDPLAFVLFGASGDLTSRKIIPALASLAADDLLPDPFVLVGVARTEMTDDGFQELCRDAASDVAREPAGAAPAPSGDPSAGGASPEGAARSAQKPAWEEVVSGFRYVTGDYDSDETFAALADLLSDLDESCGTGGNRCFYLATLPRLFGEVAAGLGRHGLNAPGTEGGFARLVVEKPFGEDLASSQRLDTRLHESFAEDQIYRIDHYMGKETVQNVLALRFANAIFEPIWNRRYVDQVQVTVAESIGVEHRGAFYEGAGALRDIVQNHVMQVLALTLMEPPATMDPAAIRDEKVKLLRSIMVPSVRAVEHDVVRAQYDAGTVDGGPAVAYREEEGVAARSTTETFVAMRLQVDNWRWAGVPLYVRTGKRLPERSTQVAMLFQRAPHLPFAGALVTDLRPDALVLRIQPDEGISLSFGAKVPGQAFRVRSVAMDFSYQEEFGGRPAEAYERLLLDAMTGDPTLFIRADEVEQAWTVLAPVQAAFAADSLALAHYPAGSWGPESADELLEASGDRWHNP
ncbi:MAG: glucose-6-phosphate dehydrogenase, partial [Acidimicrobiales bacterium]